MHATNKIFVRSATDTQLQLQLHIDMDLDQTLSSEMKWTELEPPNKRIWDETCRTVES